jgi:putative NADH-flavin reductase
MKKILVFGSTGRTGQAVVTQALDQGYEVTAFARDPVRLRTEHRHLRAVTGDVLDAASVEAAVPGHDAVLSVLGHPSLREHNVLTEGTSNIVAAMEKAFVRRLVAVSSLGVGDSREQLKLVYNLLMVPVFLRNVYADKETQEQRIRESHLDWTIVRPGLLTDGPRTGEYRVALGTAEVPTHPEISRADVADFLLEQITDASYVGKTPGLFY